MGCRHIRNGSRSSEAGELHESQCHKPMPSVCELSFYLPFPSQHIAKTPNPPSNVYFKALDFFNFPLPDDGKKFVLAYDFTFLCALPPSLRQAWGKRYAEIIEKDGQSPFHTWGLV